MQPNTLTRREYKGKFMQDPKQDPDPDSKSTEKQDPDPETSIPDLQHCTKGLYGTCGQSSGKQFDVAKYQYNKTLLILHQ